MQLVLTAEWIVVIIILVLLLICGQLWLVARRSRSVVVPETKSETEPPAPPPPIPSRPPEAPSPPLLRRIPSRPEPLECPFGPWDLVPKAPNPAQLRPAEAQIKMSSESSRARSHSTSSSTSKCTGISISGVGISGVSTSASSSAQRSLYRDPQEIRKQNAMKAAQPQFRATQSTAGRRATPMALPRTLPLRPPLHPRQPADTVKPVPELKTVQSSAWRQSLPTRPTRPPFELVPQDTLHRPRQQCEEMPPALWRPSPSPPIHPVKVQAHHTEPPELLSFSLRRSACGPEPALKQPRLSLMHTSQKPQTGRSLQTAEVLPPAEMLRKPGEMSQRWKPHRQLPAQLLESSRCPVFDARPRPLRFVEVPALSLQKLNQSLPRDQVTVHSVLPGPVIWTCSSVKDPSMCTSVQLRKPENPVWPTNGNPHGPKRPETEPGFPKTLAHSASKVNPARVALDEEEAVASEEAPSPKKNKTVRGAGQARPQTPSASTEKRQGTSKRTGLQTPKLDLGRSFARGKTAPLGAGSSQASGPPVAKRRANPGDLDSTLGGPAHIWNRSSKRHTTEETPGPGDYSPTHPGMHGRKH